MATAAKNQYEPSAQVEEMVPPSLDRVAEGIPRYELKIAVDEATICEEALKKEIAALEAALTESATATTPEVKTMIDSEVTPPDRYFTVSALLGRLRDELAVPLPPNSTLPALRAQHSILPPPPSKKKKVNPPVTVQGLEKQQQILALRGNPEYTKVHETPAALLTLWKKISNHRSSSVFRRPVNPKEAPGYSDRILFPMDLSLVRKMIMSRMIVSFADMHQRIGLICHNCLKFNGRESDYGLVTRDFESMADEFFLATVAAASAKAAQQQQQSGGAASGEARKE